MPGNHPSDNDAYVSEWMNDVEVLCGKIDNLRDMFYPPRYPRRPTQVFKLEPKRSDLSLSPTDWAKKTIENVLYLIEEVEGFQRDYDDVHDEIVASARKEELLYLVWSGETPACAHDVPLVVGQHVLWELGAFLWHKVHGEDKHCFVPPEALWSQENCEHFEPVLAKNRKSVCRFVRSDLPELEAFDLREVLDIAYREAARWFIACRGGPIGARAFIASFNPKAEGDDVGIEKPKEPALPTAEYERIAGVVSGLRGKLCWCYDENNQRVLRFSNGDGTFRPLTPEELDTDHVRYAYAEEGVPYPGGNGIQTGKTNAGSVGKPDAKQRRLSGRRLPDRKMNVLITLHKRGAMSRPHRLNRGEIAEHWAGGSYNAESLNHVLAEMVRERYLESHRGSDGGYWLTQLGLSEVVKHLHDA